MMLLDHRMYRPKRVRLFEWAMTRILRGTHVGQYQFGVELVPDMPVQRRIEQDFSSKTLRSKALLPDTGVRPSRHLDDQTPYFIQANQVSLYVTAFGRTTWGQAATVDIPISEFEGGNCPCFSLLAAKLAAMIIDDSTHSMMDRALDLDQVGGPNDPLVTMWQSRLNKSISRERELPRVFRNAKNDDDIRRRQKAEREQEARSKRGPNRYTPDLPADLVF